MKQKLLLFLFCLLGGFVANAADDPGNGSRKDECNGTVLQAGNRKPLKDVSVTAYNSQSKKEKIVSSDEQGVFAFDDLKPGVYKFVFEKTGYKKVTKEKVVIKTDETFQMQIEMIEMGDYDILPSPFSIGGL
ncbi:MAG: carboxypeptidase regulatory-like domain-containing protein [Chitinophagaceae bacterium]|nr:carboxypeptidase regulatory-like domain-containing protein [Chitinophagaceae bacterium]